MSSSSDSTGTSSGDRPHQCHRGARRCGANWSGLNVATMVAGFVIFWPIGLFLLIWIIIGRDVQELPSAIRRQWSRLSDAWTGHGGSSVGEASDNVVFNEFQQAQYERIREIKDEIRNRARRFRDFRANAKRRADEEEFDRFMSDAPLRDRG